MSSSMRALAKRVLPHSLAHGLFKRVWEKLKLQRDRQAFSATNPGVPYVYLDPGEVAKLRAQGFFGQIGQDYFLDLLFDQPNGRFIDIGANNPQANSNTLYFEKKGWQGYAFDPLRSLGDRWKSRPRTCFFNAGISDKVETRTFVEILPRVGWEHQLSAFEEFVRAEDLREYESIRYPVECAPVSHFIDRADQFEIVSIDVEGAESLILAGFDFSGSPPLAIMLENVSRIGGVDAHRELLRGHGYKLAARLNASDDLFVHESHPMPERFLLALHRHAINGEANTAK